MEIGQRILQEIEEDERTAARYLLESIHDGSRFEAAVSIVEINASQKDRAFLDARRTAVHGKSKDYSRWVLKTQQNFTRLMESRHGKQVWESESQLKRRWKNLVRLVAEVAARLK